MMTDNSQDGATAPPQGWRVAWVDLTKGLCIILVIFAHTDFLSTPVAYLFGFSGIALIMYVSKAIGHIPIVSYIGRYSIIPLCRKFLPKFTAQEDLIVK